MSSHFTGKQKEMYILTVVLGRILTKPISINELLIKAKQNDVGLFAIQGQIYDFEQRTVSNGTKWLVKGAIFDGHDEITFQTFLEVDFFPNGMALDKGDFALIEGELINDKYTGFEWSLQVKSAVQLEDTRAKKVDESENKRVELQTFSQMSKMRSALDVESLVSHAAQLGHSHIALSDVHGIQAFPAAHSAAQKHGVQMIYGTTMSLALTDNKIVYGKPTHQSLRDVVYVAFDVETTGLSTVDDHIIEIGATKYQNGKVMERFQTFVKSPKLIPAHIEELTGITQDMIDTEGVELSKAMELYHVFKSGAVLIAHNATFDRDFIQAAYDKLGMENEQQVIIDTLEIARSLEPNARSNRLNVVVKRYAKKIEAMKKELRAEERTIKKTLKNMEDEVLELRLREITREMEQLEERKKTLNLDNHHRADEDAEVTGHALMEMLNDLEELGITHIHQLNNLLGDEAYKRAFPKDITVLATNDVGKKNLYTLLTKSHLEYIHGKPRITKEEINNHREGLLIGSGSHEGHLFELVANKPIEQAFEEAKFYDYIEIQPVDIASHMVAETSVASLEAIEMAWKKIYKIGNKLNKPVVATGHVHYISEDDALIHNVLLYHETTNTSYNRRKGRKGTERKGRYLRTTKEMKDAFPWLPEEEREKIVVTNTRAIAEQCEEIAPVPKDLYAPKIEGANEELRDLSIQKAVELYGSPLPDYVQARLDKELDSIIGHGFAVIYLISQKLVKNSMDNGYLVGSRGSVGSSFVATMTGITEVNPLKPHYTSLSTSWSVFFDHEEIASGYDLPTKFGDLLNDKLYSEDARAHVIQRFKESFGIDDEEVIIEKMMKHTAGTCPITGEENKLLADGQDIPFETFLGFNGDKVPDIDLNFSGEYQTTSHKHVEELFGSRHTFRAGTVGTVADKTAFGYAMAYSEENELGWNKTKVSRLAKNMQGAKRTSGQHPGGILVVPNDMDPEDFTPVQHPAEKPESGVRTSHFDFHAIHDQILKLDILGHDDPTILRLLQDSTGIDPKTVKPNNEMVLKLFTSPAEALNIDMKSITANTGTLGVPEFGTEFVQQMIEDTKPTTFAELVKISGLSHGTDVWLGNAKDLINKEIVTLKDVIDTRDTIMVNLMQRGLEPGLAFTIMESVRKGKGLKEEWIEEMKKFNVPDWFIESCLKIKYMFPKAHAAAYVLSAMRIANFKVFNPIDFYAAVMSVRYGDEDILELNKPPEQLRTRIPELQSEIGKLKGRGEGNKANKIGRLRNAMELMLEAKVRGVNFGNISIEDSHATRYTIKEGVIIPPFASIPGIGDKAAVRLHEEFKIKPFESVDDMKQRTGVSSTNIDVLRDFGCLEKIEDVQYTLF